MSVMNCHKCGRAFSQLGGVPLCPACVKIEEQLFEEVKDYLRDNPGATMTEITEETGASAKKILRYIREGRLEPSKGIQGEITCDRCGVTIGKGKFCDKCANRLGAAIKGIAPGAEGAARKPSLGGPKMHTRRDL